MNMFIFIYLFSLSEETFRKYWDSLKSFSKEIFVVTVRYCNWISEAVCNVEMEPLQSYFIN
jgi:hypothetical protein